MNSVSQSRGVGSPGIDSPLASSNCNGATPPSPLSPPPGSPGRSVSRNTPATERLWAPIERQEGVRGSGTGTARRRRWTAFAVRRTSGMGGEGVCDGELVLRLGYQGWGSRQPSSRVKLEPSLMIPCSTTLGSSKPSLSLSLPEVDGTGGGGEPRVQLARPSSPHIAVSSFSGAYPTSSGGTKREKGAVREEVDAERGVSYRASDEEEVDAQSALLEDMFREHSTLNPKQKQALAKQLNLRPRQVEVWFQNRRAAAFRRAGKRTGGGTRRK